MKDIKLWHVVLLGAAVWFGIVKLPNSCKDVKDGNFPISDLCFRKEVAGEYSISVQFIESENRLYKIQKMELRYVVNLTKDECTIQGSGKKTGSTVIDTLTQIRGKLFGPKEEIVATGGISNDSLYINLFLDSKPECNISITFPFPEKNISVLKGTFTSECPKSSGSAILRR